MLREAIIFSSILVGDEDDGGKLVVYSNLNIIFEFKRICI